MLKQRLALLLFSSLTLSAPLPGDIDADDKRLIKTSETMSLWMTEQDILQLIGNGTHFVDVTDHQDFYDASSQESGDISGTR
jgi:hypothetical protein